MESLLKLEYRRKSFEEVPFKLNIFSESINVPEVSDSELSDPDDWLIKRGVATLALPNGFGYGSSGLESGYASLATTPDNEHPPFDWPVITSPIKAEFPAKILEESEFSDCELDFNLLNIAMEDLPEEPEPEESQTNKDHVGAFGEPAIPLKFLVHPYISVEPEPSTLYSGQPITYKIDLGDTKIHEISSIRSYIIAPCGKPIYPVREIDYLASQLVCKFRTLEHGIHTVIATWDAKDLVGSPLKLKIGRNYSELQNQNQRPIVSFDMELDSTGDKDGNHFLRKPWGLAVDTKRETIYATDREHHEILAYAPDGEFLFSFGSRGNENGEFRRPTGIAFDPVHDRIYVTDKDNHRVQIFSPTGAYLGQFGKVGQDRGDFFFPWGIAVSPDGNSIAVADSRNHRIQMLTKDGKFLRKFYPRAKRGTEGLTHAEFLGWQYPRGVCFDNKGEHIFVTDFNGHGIFKIHISFTHYEKIAGEGELRRPSGLTVDEIGNILVSDHRNNSIKVYTSEGVFLNNLQTLGSSATIELPTDVAVLRGGYLVTLDCNGRIRII